MTQRNRSASLTVILCTLIALPLACSGSSEPEVPSGSHPIVVLNIGTLRADHLGCYGYGRATSPNIDALAAESAMFQWAFSQAPSTAPAQASLLTGLYPSSHGLTTEGGKVPEKATTFAEALAEHGYTTAAFVDGGFLSPDFGMGQGFSLYDNNQGTGLKEIGPKAINWMKEHASENFLLMIHTYDVHTPYDPPAPHREKFLAGLAPASEGFTADAATLEAIRVSSHTDSPKTLPENDLEVAKALYDGEIANVDAWVGEFMTEFRNLGLDKIATLVLVSDHGEEFQEHGSVLHEKLYTSVTHVPLIIRLPGGQFAGPVSKIVETMDLMPTLLELAGAAIPATVQADSLVPMIRGESTPPYIAHSESAFFDGQRAVAIGGYHLITSLDGETTELYHLPQDPMEQQDISDVDTNRRDVMLKHIASWEKKVASFSITSGDDASVGDETLDQLRSLGYVQ